MSYNGHIAVEGPIGVGKTTLAELLAERLNGKLIREPVDDNPYLADFYKNRERFAFQTQIFFLMNRYSRQEQFAYGDLFSACSISDYLFAKDRIFARINLTEKEFVLYDKVSSALERNAPPPDLAIYLTADVDFLMRRIKKRGRPYEKGIDRKYLETLIEAYSGYFFHYSDSPLLVIKADNVDFIRDSEKFSYLIDKIISKPSRTEYISFDSLAIDGK